MPDEKIGLDGAAKAMGYSPSDLRALLQRHRVEEPHEEPLNPGVVEATPKQREQILLRWRQTASIERTAWHVNLHVTQVRRVLRQELGGNEL